MDFSCWAPPPRRSPAHPVIRRLPRQLLAVAFPSVIMPMGALANWMSVPSGGTEIAPMELSPLGIQG